jgi:hypothetical protein
MFPFVKMFAREIREGEERRHETGEAFRSGGMIIKKREDRIHFLDEAKSEYEHGVLWKID